MEISYDLEKLLAIKEENKYLALDSIKDEHEVIDFEISDIASYFVNNNLMVVDEDNKIGLIDQQGDMILAPKYYTIERLDSKFMLGYNRNSGLYGIIDNNGMEVVPSKYKRIRKFSNKVAAVQDQNGKWGFINEDGIEIIKPMYEETGYFSEGLIPVKLNGKWGFIDETGNTIIDYQYEDARSFSDGLAAVCNNRIWGFIDKTGKTIIEHQYQYTYSANELYFRNGRAIVAPNNCYNLIIIDTNNKTVGELPFNCEVKGFQDDRMFIKYRCGYRNAVKFGITDLNGKPILARKYCGYMPYSEGLAALMDENGKWGFVDKDGKTVINFIYDNVKSYSDGLAAVCMNDEWGYIDKEGNVVIDYQYERAESFHNGQAMVSKKDEHEKNIASTINKEGKELITFNGDYLRGSSDGNVYITNLGKNGEADLYNAKQGKVTKVHTKYAILKNKNTYHKAFEVYRLKIQVNECQFSHLLENEDQVFMYLDLMYEEMNSAAKRAADEALVRVNRRTSSSKVSS